MAHVPCRKSNALGPVPYGVPRVLKTCKSSQHPLPSFSLLAGYINVQIHQMPPQTFVLLSLPCLSSLLWMEEILLKLMAPLCSLSFAEALCKYATHDLRRGEMKPAAYANPRVTMVLHSCQLKNSCIQTSGMLLWAGCDLGDNFLEMSVIDFKPLTSSTVQSLAQGIAKRAWLDPELHCPSQVGMDCRTLRLQNPQTQNSEPLTSNPKH